MFWRWSIFLIGNTDILFQVFIGGTAEIIQPNITAENGFVHVIDKVRVIYDDSILNIVLFVHNILGLLCKE